MTIKPGDLFASLNPELDSDENDQDRTTPAGSVWRVIEVAPTYIGIVCDATGGWINPDADELARDFRPATRAEALAQALAWALAQIEDDLDPDHQEAMTAARALLESPTTADPLLRQCADALDALSDYAHDATLEGDDPPEACATARQLVEKIKALT